MSKNIIRTLCVLAGLVFAYSLQAQGLLLPFIPQQFLDMNGNPLAGGKLYQCSSVGACPGTQQATYNSSSLSTANANPLTLDGSGRATSGVWLTPGAIYNFVTTTAQGALVSTMLNVMGPISVAPPSLAPCNTVSPNAEIQYYSTLIALGCSPNLTWNPTGNVLGVTGTTAQASIVSYQGYFQSYDGFLSTVPGGGSWNAFNSPTDGAALRGYYVSQTTANNAGGYIDVAPISYNPYNSGTQCVDSYGNPVQQPFPLNGSSGFGPNDALLWVGTSPAMPANGSCGAPLPISPSQTYGGVANQSFGLFTNAYFFARAGLATDIAAFNAIQALSGGAYLKLGLTTDQGVYLRQFSTTTGLNAPAAPYGGLAYEGGVTGSLFWYYNAVTASWNQVDLSMTGGGGGIPGAPTNSIQTNSGGVFTGYSWLLAIPGEQAISALGGFTTTSGAGACALSNCIQAPLGGLFAGLGVTAGQAFYPAAWTTTSGLNTPASGFGGFTYAGASVGTGATYRYYNASTPGWATVDFSTSGSGCTLGGTNPGQILSNQSGACASYSNLTWNSSTNQLGIAGGTSATQSIVIASGYGLANGGWNAGTCTSPTCIQAPTGGFSAGLGYTAGQGFYSFNFAPVGGVAPSGLNPPASGYGGIAYAGTGLYWAWSGTAWYSWTPGSGGGGGSCPGGSIYQIQYNNGGSACAGSTNLTFNAGTNILNIGGALTILGNPSINTSNQFVGAGGVNVANAISGTSITGSSTIQSTLGSGVAFQSGSGAFQAYANGNVNGLNINASTSVEISGTAMINSSGQFVGYGGVNTSGAVVSSSSIDSTVGGSGTAFQGGGGTFIVNGNGTVSALGFQGGAGGIYTTSTLYNSVQAYGGIRVNAAGTASGCAFEGFNTCVITLAGQGIFPAGVVAGAAINANGGLISEFAVGATAYNIVNGSGGFLNGGVTCSGSPTSSFASVGGIVTHC